MEKCFVIQPFDNGKFDTRFKDVFEPAIRRCGLEPYRVDNDWTVKVPIESIENGIKDSSIVFAEITTDNPNVWYELGYAFACGKDVIMVCSDERLGGKFPFDIQNRFILTYKTASKSDFEKLEEAIEKKIIGIKQTQKTIVAIHENPIVDTEGLKSHEIAILILLAENQLTSEEWLPVYTLKEGMNRIEYADIATSLGIKTLGRKDFIRTSMDSGYNNNEYPVIQLSATGIEWLINNQDQFNFTREKKLPLSNATAQSNSDELPF